MTSEPEWFNYHSIEHPNAGWAFVVGPRDAGKAYAQDRENRRMRTAMGDDLDDQ